MRLWFYIVQGLANARWKNLVSIALCGIKLFSLSFCKLRRDCLTGIGHGTMVLTKRLHYFHFSIAKGGTKTIGHLPIAEGLSFRSLDRCIYDCKRRNEKKDSIHVRREFSLPLSNLVA
jgi:hypothetical protein